MENITDTKKQLEASKDHWNELMTAIQSLPSDAEIGIPEELLEEIDSAFTPAISPSAIAKPGFNAIRV